MWAPNVTGLVLGLCQLALKLIFPNKDKGTPGVAFSENKFGF